MLTGRAPWARAPPRPPATTTVPFRRGLAKRRPPRRSGLTHSCRGTGCGTHEGGQAGAARRDIAKEEQPQKNTTSVLP